MNDSEDRPDLVDTLLRERAGGHAEPDLTDAVLARLQRGEAAVQAGRLRWDRAPFARRSRTWIAAAVLLLGLGVVAAVAFTRRANDAAAVEPSVPEPMPQDPVRQDPAPTPPTPRATTIRDLFLIDVIDPMGGPVPSYRFDLLRVVSRAPAAYDRVGSLFVPPGEGSSGAIPWMGCFHVRFTGVDPFEHTIEGVTTDGDYVVVVTDEMHAKTTSEPFAIAEGTQPKVQVRMSAGVAFELEVGTPAGKPIADVVVATAPSCAEFGIRNAEGKLLFSSAELVRPNLLSTLFATTSKSGTATFRRVTPGKYRLVFRHPDYCTTVLDPVEVPLAAPLEPVRMIPGAVVRGTVQGKPEAVAGAKLTLSPKDGTTPSAGLWPMVTYANAKGEFAFDSHVPPGAYRMTPLREPSTAHVLSNAQGVVRDSVEFEVEEGQTEVQIDPRIHGN